MDKTRGNLPLTITLGALWGLLEATVGWGMHAGHLPYRSLLLFPIGAALMLIGVYCAGRSWKFRGLQPPYAWLSSFASPLARRFRWMGPVSLFLVAILVNHFTL